MSTILTTSESPSDYLEQNLKALKNLSKSTTTYKHFQSAFSNGGWVPTEGQSEPTNSVDLDSSAARIAALIIEGNLKDAEALLRQIQGGYRVVPSSAVKAVPNAEGVTQIRTNGFSDEQKNVLHLNSDTVKAARKAFKAERKTQIQKSLDAKNVGIFSTGELAKTGDVTNFDRVTIFRFNKKQEDAQLEAITPDPQMLAANKRALAVKREREARLAAGCGNVDDLQAKLNALKA
jgi:hypothetical protein